MKKVYIKHFTRRKFLKGSLLFGVSINCGSLLAACGGGGGGGGSSKTSGPYTSNQGLGIIDAHSHIGKFYREEFRTYSPEYAALLNSDFCVTCLSATGDHLFQGFQVEGLDETGHTTESFARAHELVDAGIAQFILTPDDLEAVCSGNQPPGFILTMEGADPLAGNLDYLDRFYEMGIRSITLIHYHNNELGDVQTVWRGDSGPFKGGLTEFGQQVIQRMEQLGMLVDVTHASSDTLAGILDVVTKPIIDTHTGPRYSSNLPRLRTWDELEAIAATGGLVGSWPIKMDNLQRQTIDDWGDEILDMVDRLGVDHVCVGTDADGLPSLVDGYESISDLYKLGNYLINGGLTEVDVLAIFGGNLQRLYADILSPVNPGINNLCKIRIRIQSNSDFALLFLVEGGRWFRAEEISASPSASEIRIVQEEQLTQINQNIDLANQKNEVELIVDVRLARFNADPEVVFRLEKGGIGDMTVEIVNGAGQVVDALTWFEGDPGVDDAKLFAVATNNLLRC